jgi:hypothetical protein
MTERHLTEETSVLAYGIKSPDGSLWLQAFGTAALAAQYCAEGAMSAEEFKRYPSHNQRWPVTKKRGYEIVMVRITEEKS